MKRFTIGKLAKITNTGSETIRFYEKQGLLEEPEREASGYRKYDEIDISRLHFIKNAKELGFTLREIKDFFTLSKLQGKKSILGMAKQKMEEIEQKINSLNRMKRALKALTSSCQNHGGGHNCPLLLSFKGVPPERRK
ncbi:MAG: MerR family transcriptional regulator [Deltaproteobacteria bacterium]|nr:MerR family transcriptional regulator [Deltaproteobacteria bacterium]